MIRVGICIAICAVLALATSDKPSEDDRISHVGCDETDTLCSVRKQLMNVLDRLDKMAAEDEDETVQKRNSFLYRKTGHVALGKRLSDKDSDSKHSMVDKRKSTYVRFGKRTGLDDELSGLEKRKSAYVRFGRSV